MDKALTADLARKLLRYEPETGKLFWLPRPVEFFDALGDWKMWNTRYAGAEAFTAYASGGYHTGAILGVTYRAHRVAWLIQTGDWPEGQIDHINGRCDDNRFANLRIATVSENQRNKALLRNNKSGVNGVHWCKRSQKWRASARVNGRHLSLGYFVNFEDAKFARQHANIKNGFTDRHGASAA